VKPWMTVPGHRHSVHAMFRKHYLAAYRRHLYRQELWRLLPLIWHVSDVEERHVATRAATIAAATLQMQ
jgi:hypothetical protein